MMLARAGNEIVSADRDRAAAPVAGSRLRSAGALTAKFSTTSAASR